MHIPFLFNESRMFSSTSHWPKCGPLYAVDARLCRFRSDTLFAISEPSGKSSVLADPDAVIISDILYRPSAAVRIFVVESGEIDSDALRNLCRYVRRRPSSASEVHHHQFKLYRHPSLFLPPHPRRRQTCCQSTSLRSPVRAGHSECAPYRLSSPHSRGQ